MDIRGEHNGGHPYCAKKTEKKFLARADLQNQVLTPGGLLRAGSLGPALGRRSNKYAYQGMRGKIPKFEILHNEDLMHPSPTELCTHGITGESKLYIQPVSAKMGYKPLDDGNAWGQLVVGPREPRLIRVYCGERQSPKFSFWMPKGTRNSMSLIIFRHWRYMTEKGQPIYDNDVDIWTNMRYNGDNQVVGERKNHWDNLSSMNFRTANVHTNDALYAIDGETDPGTDPEVPAKNMKVLKVSIYQHRSEASVEQDKKKKEKKLSRVWSSLLVEADRKLTQALLSWIPQSTFSTRLSTEYLPTI